MAHDQAFTPAQLEVDAEGVSSALTAVGARAEALVQAWVKAGNAAAVQEAAERGSGAARKAARRGLNVLKSRGVAIPEPWRPGAGTKTPTEADQVHALMLAPDGSGVVLFAIYSRSQTGRTRACFVMLQDGAGIVRVENGDLSQSRMREQIRRAFPALAYEPVEVPAGWARARIAAARKAHAARGRIEPLGFDTAAALLLPAPDEMPSHPFDDEGFEFSDDDALDLTQDSARMHQWPEFRGWFPPAPAVDEMLRKLGERFAPGQSPEADTLTEWVKQEVAAATDRYFTQEQREVLVARLKDAGLSVLSRDGEQAALQLGALIQVISKAGLVTDPPQNVAFLRGFFEKALSLLAARNRGNLPIPVPAGSRGADPASAPA